MRQDRISKAFKENGIVHNGLLAQGGDLVRLAERILEVFHGGGRLLVVGGGSLGGVAALIANRFLYRLSLERPSLPALSLGLDAQLATALARDGGSSQYFSRQLQALTTGGDLLLILSEVWPDEAVQEALQAARRLGCSTAAVVPRKVEPADPPDFLFCLDTDSVARMAEGALLFGQLLCEMVEGELFGT
jgi:D-sedoheptulose 7-phosphate isomerase